MGWLLKTIPAVKRMAPYLAAIAALATYTAFIYDMGKDAQEAEHNAALAEAARQYKEDVDDAVTAALELQQEDFQDELRRARNDREVVVKTEEVVKYVDRIKTVPAECAPIARDVVRVLQQSTDLVREAGYSDAD